MAVLFFWFNDSILLWSVVCCLLQSRRILGWTPRTIVGLPTFMAESYAFAPKSPCSHFWLLKYLDGQKIPSAFQKSPKTSPKIWCSWSHFFDGKRVRNVRPPAAKEQWLHPIGRTWSQRSLQRAPGWRSWRSWFFGLKQNKFFVGQWWGYMGMFIIIYIYVDGGS